MWLPDEALEVVDLDIAEDELGHYGFTQILPGLCVLVSYEQDHRYPLHGVLAQAQG
jgi:hypothetical protein